MSTLAAAFLFLSLALAGQENQSIALTLSPGAPLRLYLTKKVTKRTGSVVEAKVLEPVFAFDHEVVPAGAIVLGRVTRLDPVPKWQRASAILAGDFTPLHKAQIEFTMLILPDGSKVALRTNETVGLNSVYWPIPPRQKKPAGGNKKAGVGKQTMRDTINAQVNARSRGIADIVRSPNKRERLLDLAMSKLPYHPQWVRRGTRFDAELRDPVQFGNEPATKGAFALMGSQPPADSVVHARLITALDSATAAKGEAIQAVITQPLFSAEHKLILPEGTRLAGMVVTARPARWFHRGGQLRFSFQQIDLPLEAARLRFAGPEPAPMRTTGTLEAAESGGKTPVKVDSEGGVKAAESKTRFIAPLIAVLIANRAADNDAGRHATTGGADANVGGRTIGGGSGFGLLGAAAAQSSRYVGTALGFYGMAWSVYTNVIARGAEVQFDKNAVIEIRFGTRTPPAVQKFRGEVAGAGGN